MPIDVGVNVKISCERGEGALLNLETGHVTFSYCQPATKLRLGNYLKENYINILKGFKYADVIEADDLFLVTGTYMTKNWEAATFVMDSNSLGGGVALQATDLASGHFSIDWRSCALRNGGFNTGHVHLGQSLPNHNSVPSFGACCHCDETPENQCIFLRGWRIREMIRFSESSLVIPISVESVTNTEWRRAQFIRKQSKSVGSSLLGVSRSSQAVVGGQRDKIVGELEEVPENPDYVGALIIFPFAFTFSMQPDIYDFVSIGLYQVYLFYMTILHGVSLDNGMQQTPCEVVMIHDDDVIDFLGGLLIGRNQLRTLSPPPDVNNTKGGEFSNMSEIHDVFRPEIRMPPINMPTNLSPQSYAGRWPYIGHKQSSRLVHVSEKYMH